MAKILSKVGITTGNTVEDYHVSQSIDAFTGIDAYDISLSGSFKLTGSLFLKELTDTTQLNILTYNPSTFQVFNTSSIGFLYPLSSSLAADINNLSSSVSTDINNLSSSFTTTINNLSSSFSTEITDLSASIADLTGSGDNFANADLTFNSSHQHNTDGYSLFISVDGNFTTASTTDGFFQMAPGKTNIGYSQSAQTQFNPGGGFDIKHIGDTVITGSLSVTGITQGNSLDPIIIYNTSSGKFFYNTLADIISLNAKPKAYVQVGSGSEYLNGVGIGRISSGYTPATPNIAAADLSLKFTGSSFSEGDQIIWKTQYSDTSLNGFKLLDNTNITYLIGEIGTYAPMIQVDYDSDFGNPEKVHFNIELIKFNDGTDKFLIDVKQINYYNGQNTNPSSQDPVTTAEANIRYTTPNPEWSGSVDTVGIGLPHQVMTFSSFVVDAPTGNDIYTLTLQTSYGDPSPPAAIEGDFSYCRVITA